MSSTLESALLYAPAKARKTTTRKHRYWRKVLEKLRYGELHMQFDDGAEISALAPEAGPSATIAIHNPAKLLWKLVHSGDLGFGEAYMKGYWSTPDLSQLLYLLCMNLGQLETQEKKPWAMRALHRWQHALNRNSLSGSRRNIMRHYDLGNDFYRRWLDNTMSYSSAIYHDSLELEAAQNYKYKRLFDQLEARPGDEILEIGCGWGGFMEYAAQRGCRVTGITLSPSQRDYALERLQKAGVADRVEVRLQDYRDLNQQFDHVVSIEMFEAVGREWWGRYFEVVNNSLRPGGRAALQIITIDEQYFDEYVEAAGGFIQKYIFPGGMLPTSAHLLQHASDAGLEGLSLEAFGTHYADTLAEWRDNFNAEQGWLETHGYDQRFQRMWNYYLAFCEAGFRDERLDLMHLQLLKPSF